MKKAEFPKILVVDDEAIVREVLEEFLSLMDFQTVNANDGFAGIQALESSTYCAAFADIRMPGMDGIGFLKQSRRIRPDLPVIIITGHGCDDTQEAALAAGAFAFIRKPFRYHQIKEILDKILPND
ncbi:MAG: response regulator [Thermodesulfobacteriota bacterium]